MIIVARPSAAPSLSPPITLPSVRTRSLFLIAHPNISIAGEKTPETLALRKHVSKGCEKLILDFFEAGGQVVIYDANNGTQRARQTLAEKFDKEGIHVILLGKHVRQRCEGSQLTAISPLLESICDNKEIIETNIRSVKISSPDVGSHSLSGMTGRH